MYSSIADCPRNQPPRHREERDATEPCPVGEAHTVAGASRAINKVVLLFALGAMAIMREWARSLLLFFFLRHDALVVFFLQWKD